MNEKERNEKEATDKASEAAASLSQFAAKPIKVMSSCRGRLRWGWEWGGCCLAMIWGWQTQPHTQSTRAEPAQQPLPRGQTKPNPNPSSSQTRHGQVLYALRVRSISCLGHVLDSDSDLPWLEWRLVDFNSLLHSHSPSLPLQNFTRSLRRQQRQKMRQIVRYWRHAPKCQAADKRVVSASHLSLSHVPHTHIDRLGEGEELGRVCNVAFLSFNFVVVQLL